MKIERLGTDEFAPAQDLDYHDVLGLFDFYEGLAFHDNLILVGPKGIGKTLSVAAYAAQVGSPLVTFDCSEDMRRNHMVGNYILRGEETPFILGPATTAFEIANETGQCILVLEEINALTPQIQKTLNALTDFRKRLEVPEAKKVFRLEPGAKLWVVGTMNTAVYGGVYMLNEDLKSRFNLLPLDYPANAQEIKILESAVNGSLSKQRVVIDGLMRLAQETRQGELAYALSTRDLVQMLNNAGRLGIKKTMRLALGKFDDEDRKTVKKWIQSIFGV
jgi:nitric oxide reductase NorQ protein